tara:strand:+ start:141 stop:530 length:390 start_codon:yes stop_codon:yes gene_type:complete
MKIFSVLCFLIFANFSIVKSSFAQGTIEDQYKQMGGIVALTEMCFGTKSLEKVLFQQLGGFLYNNHDSGRDINNLLNLYFESYDIAKQKKVLWIGSLKEYNKSPFTCSRKDKEFIEIREKEMIKSLSSS